MSPEERDRLARLEANEINTLKMLEEVRDDVKAIREQANKWKGAFTVLLGLGGILGFAANTLKEWFLK